MVAIFVVSWLIDCECNSRWRQILSYAKRSLPGSASVASLTSADAGKAIEKLVIVATVIPVYAGIL